VTRPNYLLLWRFSFKKTGQSTWPNENKAPPLQWFAKEWECLAAQGICLPVIGHTGRVVCLLTLCFIVGSGGTTDSLLASWGWKTVQKMMSSSRQSSVGGVSSALLFRAAQPPTLFNEVDISVTVFVTNYLKLARQIGSLTCVEETYYEN
jgi:hypothetical protein